MYIKDDELVFLLLGFPIPPCMSMESGVEKCPEKFKDLVIFTGNGMSPDFGWNDLKIRHSMSHEERVEFLEFLRSVTDIDIEESIIDKELAE